MSLLAKMVIQGDENEVVASLDQDYKWKFSGNFSKNKEFDASVKKIFELETSFHIMDGGTLPSAGFPPSDLPNKIQEIIPFKVLKMMKKKIPPHEPGVVY